VRVRDDSLSGYASRKKTLFCLIATVLALDNVFFGALAPLIPAYAQQLSLSNAAVGVLVAVNAIGGALCALSGALAVRRFGAKPVLLTALVVDALSSLLFALAQTPGLLIGARFGQGAASALAWTSGLTWLINAVDSDERGRSIGFAMGAAAAGSIIGPALGAMAAYVGAGPTFSVTAVGCIMLAAVGARVPETRSVGARMRLKRADALQARPAVITLTWFVSVPGLILAALVATAPLRLSALGLSPLAIAAVYGVTALSEVGLSPAVGRWSDSHGRRGALLLGSALAAAAALAFPIADRGIWAAIVAVLLGIGAIILTVPALSLMVDRFAVSHIPQEMSFALQEVGWSAGHTVGAIGAGWLSGAVSSSAPFLFIALVCIFTILLALASVSPTQRIGGTRRSGLPAGD
jgi:predicted MFS family arabinose efflux permease